MKKGLNIYYKSFFGVTISNSIRNRNREIVKIQLLRFNKPIWVNVEDLNLSINN